MDILGVFHLIIERHNIVIVQFARLNVELLFRNKLFYYVNKIIPAKNRYIINGIEIDIYVASLKLGIEYDGIYFHNSKESDEREQKKNLFCRKMGIRLIRVKENKSIVKITANSI